MSGSEPGSWDLITTKLRPPVAAAGVITRPRLLAQLSAAMTTRLTLVEAPPGYGKTTLIGQWCADAASHGTIVAWLSLDAAESDPVQFWRYLIAALRSAGYPAAPSLEVVLESPGTAMKRIVVALLNDLASSPLEVVLVLDDYHLIGDRECHELMTLFLERAPETLRVVIGTRSEPPLGLGSLRAAGRLAEVGVRDLRLNSAEAAEMLRHGERLQLEQDELRVLVSRTEGWPAAVHLAAGWLRAQADRGEAIRQFGGDHRYVADYLIEQVLSALDPKLERFLLHTAILGRMCPSLCEAVAEDPHATGILAELERANLFLEALDGRRQWYRYHPLFSEFLRAELAHREPELVRPLHARAYAWHLAHGTSGEAIHHATLAGDACAAAEIITDSWTSMIRSGRSATVQRWLQRLSPEELMATPELGYIGAVVSGLAGASEGEVERWVRIAENALAAGSAPVPGGTTSFASNVDLVRTVFLYRDVRRAAAAAQRLADLEEGGGEGRVAALATVGFLHYLCGDREAAQATISLALADREAARRPHTIIHALALQALLELDAGCPQQACESAAHAIEVARAAGLATSVTAGLAHTAHGSSLIALGRGEEGMRALELSLDALRGSAPIAPYVHALLSVAEAHRVGGDIIAAHRAADAAEALLRSFDDPGLLGAMLTRHRDRARLERGRGRFSPEAELSQAELTVLRLLAGDKSRRGIAAELVISPNTVKTHIASIYRKLGVRLRADAIAASRARQLI